MKRKRLEVKYGDLYVQIDPASVDCTDYVHKFLKGLGEKIKEAEKKMSKCGFCGIIMPEIEDSRYKTTSWRCPNPKCGRVWSTGLMA